jgi:hypothetical protein
MKAEERAVHAHLDRARELERKLKFTIDVFEAAVEQLDRAVGLLRRVQADEKEYLDGER